MHLLGHPAYMKMWINPFENDVYFEINLKCAEPRKGPCVKLFMKIH